MSFIKRLDNNAPKWDPRGTPDKTFIWFEIKP